MLLTILVTFSGAIKIQLVRHEGAFSLGQLGFTNAITALSGALSSDSSFFVRHEALSPLA